VNWAIFRSVLRALIPVAPNLCHVSLQTGTKHYLPRTGKSKPTTRRLRRTCLGLTCPIFTTLEDVLFGEVEKKKASLMNIIGALCIYAAICKKEGRPLNFPRSKAAWECYSVAADGNLIAE
ncbi:hypothetical protein DVH24_012524, partial [Malus domestica]